MTAEKLLQSFEAKNFPPTLQAMDEAVYVQFIRTLGKTVAMEKHSSSLIKTLSRLPIAADTNGKMHQPCELFYHNDEIFKAAFEDQDTFLHHCVEANEYDQLWLKIGLRRRGTDGCFKIDDYTQCLQSLEDLIQYSDYGTLVDPTSSIHGRMKKILSPLVTPSSATHLFRSENWADLATLSVFLVRKSTLR